MFKQENPLTRLIDAFQQLPGVGPKSAQRMAFHILKQPTDNLTEWTQNLLETKEKIIDCQICFNWSHQSPCEICTNRERDPKVVCVVSHPQDLFALERTGEFTGHYHVLHGLISPMNGVGPEHLRIDELLHRLDTLNQGEHLKVDEVILALPPSIEGDTTSLYLSRMLQAYQVRLTRIAFGLPVGGDLDYADNLTIARALAGRQSF